MNHDEPERDVFLFYISEKCLTNYESRTGEFRVHGWAAGVGMKSISKFLRLIETVSHRGQNRKRKEEAKKKAKWKVVARMGTRTFR